MAQTPFPVRKNPTPARPVPAGASVSARASAAARRPRLFLQLAGWFTVISLVPLCVVGYSNYRYAANGMLADNKDNLEALVKRQGSEVSGYFHSMREATDLIKGSPVIRDSMAALGNVTPANYDQLRGSPAALAVDAQWGPRFHAFVHNLQFAELYLVNPAGLVVYSAGPQGQVQMNLLAPENAKLAIADIFKDVLQKHATIPSSVTNETPDHHIAFYFAAPVLTGEDTGDFLGVLILGLSSAKFEPFLNNKVGLGESGETLVVTRHDGKFTLISQLTTATMPSFSPMQPLSGIAKFGDGITDPGVAYSAICQDFRGHEVLAAWTYLPDLEWTLIQTTDTAELFQPVTDLRNFSVDVGLFTLLAVLGVAAWVARGITRPVVQLTSVAEQIAQGDLSPVVHVSSHNEIGLLAHAVRTMARSLKSLVGKVQESATVISGNAVQVAASARQQAEAAQTTGTAALEVAATAKQISATSQELTRTMVEVNGVAQGTAQRAEAGLDGLQAIQTTMGELEQARAIIAEQLELIAKKAEGICGVTIAMTKVADQTNLLSLNAAIEARKAGEYGRGFSVVAREIQRLADQAAVSTLEIENTIEAMMEAVQAGVAGMKGFAAKSAAGIERIQTVSQQLTEVIQQVQGLPPRFEMVLQGMTSQSEGARQITDAITNMSDSAQQTATTIQEALRLLEQLRDATRGLQAEVTFFRV